MSAKYTTREIIARFHALKRAARDLVQRDDGTISRFELDLHDAAMAYAATVNKVSRAGRGR